MRKKITKIALATIIIILITLHTNFSNTPPKNKFKLSNIEALSSSESDPTEICKSSGGYCIINGMVWGGISIKD